MAHRRFAGPPEYRFPGHRLRCFCHSGIPDSILTRPVFYRKGWPSATFAFINYPVFYMFFRVLSDDTDFFGNRFSPAGVCAHTAKGNSRHTDCSAMMLAWFSPRFLSRMSPRRTCFLMMICGSFPDIDVSDGSDGPDDPGSPNGSDVSDGPDAADSDAGPPGVSAMTMSCSCRTSLFISRSATGRSLRTGRRISRGEAAADDCFPACSVSHPPAGQCVSSFICNPFRKRIVVVRIRCGSVISCIAKASPRGHPLPETLH